MRPDPDTEREIRDLIERRIAAFESGDLEAEMALWADDPNITAISTGTDEFRVGFEAIRELRSRRLNQSDVRGYRFTRMHLSSHGDVAWFASEGEMWAKQGDDERRISVRGTYVAVKIDGRWRLVSQHISTPSLNQAEGEAFPRPIAALTAALAYERPDLRSQTSQDGVVTLLFTDIEGSTSANDEVGDMRWIQVIRKHNAIVRELVAAHGGTEVKTIGDAFMVVFASPRRALQCAVALQRAFSEHNRDAPSVPLQVRIGMHAGEPVREGADFYGKSVTLASRIADQAHGSEILVSDLIKELTDAAGDFEFDFVGETTPKGFSRPQRLYAVRWDGA